jgi:hypothetical protein
MHLGLANNLAKIKTQEMQTVVGCKGPLLWGRLGAAARVDGLVVLALGEGGGVGTGGGRGRRRGRRGEA